MKETDGSLEVFIVKEQRTEVTYTVTVQAAPPSRFYYGQTEANPGSDFFLNIENTFDTRVFLEVPPSSQRTSVFVAIVDDNVPEGAEVFDLRLDFSPAIHGQRFFPCLSDVFQSSTITIFGINGK